MGNSRQNRLRRRQVAREQFKNAPTAAEKFFAPVDAASNLEAGEISGLASVFGSEVEAFVPTKVDAGAFSKTIEKNGSKVHYLWGHDAGLVPIGVATIREVPGVGLAYTASLNQSTLAKDALAYAKHALANGLTPSDSIGFNPIRIEMRKDAQGKTWRHILEVELLEISAVPFGADPKAKITDAHKQSADTDESRAPLTDEDTTWHLAFAARGVLECHEGRVLSGKNKAIVMAAIDALQKLLDAAMPPVTQSREPSRLSQLRDAQLAFARSALNVH